MATPLEAAERVKAMAIASRTAVRALSRIGPSYAANGAGTE
jgi:hypothetical protein